VKTLVLALAFTAAVLTLASDAQAQSFNCRYAKSPAEVAICQNAGLMALDRQLGQAYSEARVNMTGVRTDLRLAEFAKDQRKWLRQRNDCRSDVACLRQNYTGRLNELEQAQ